MRILFMGTPEFAVPCLETLVEQGHTIAGVVTQPDRPRGRGQKVAASPVKLLAAKYGLPVYQPATVKEPEFLECMRELAPECIVVVAFGQILPRELLFLPPYGCMNVHASLLPKYRGAAPIHWAIINGEEKTGITTMYMDVGMDTGDIILQEEVEIKRNDTVGSLHDRLAQVGARLCGETIRLIAQGNAPRLPQDHAQATYAPKLQASDEIINWVKDSQAICNQIRGMNPWPGAHTYQSDGRRLKIWRAVLPEDVIPGWERFGAVRGIPGGVHRVINGYGFTVYTLDGAILVQEVQPENGKRIEAGDYIRGYRLEPGQRFGKS